MEQNIHVDQATKALMTLRREEKDSDLCVSLAFQKRLKLIHQKVWSFTLSWLK